MARERDSQRSKYQKASRALQPFCREELTLNECRAFAEEVIGTRWFRSRHAHVRGIITKDGRARRSATSYTSAAGYWVLVLPTHTRNRKVILVLLAFRMIPPTAALHGREFAKLMLQLVERFISPEAKAALKEAYVENKVRYRAKPTYSEETLAKKKALGDALSLGRSERAIAKLEDDYRV